MATPLSRMRSVTGRPGSDSSCAQPSIRPRSTTSKHTRQDDAPRANKRPIDYVTRSPLFADASDPSLTPKPNSPHRSPVMTLRSSQENTENLESHKRSGRKQRRGKKTCKHFHGFSILEIHDRHHAADMTSTW
jgi:hypothetical protein